MSYYKRPETKYYFYCENCGAEEGVYGEDDDNRVLGRYCTHCFEANLPNALEVYKGNNNVTYNELLEKYFDDTEEKQKEIPLYFTLYDYQGNHVNMFSRTCKAVKSRELYTYFENNETVKMKIN